MSYLHDKSKTNFKAAKLLIENELSASSIHCSYYGVFQFLVCKYAITLNKTFDNIVSETKGSDSHNYIIDGLIKQIKFSFREMEMVQKNIEEANLHKNVKRKIKDLKNYRIKSDYRNVEINKEMSVKCNIMSQNIVKEINEYLS